MGSLEQREVVLIGSATVGEWQACARSEIEFFYENISRLDAGRAVDMYYPFQFQGSRLLEVQLSFATPTLCPRLIVFPAPSVPSRPHKLEVIAGESL